MLLQPVKEACRAGMRWENRVSREGPFGIASQRVRAARGPMAGSTQQSAG
jgi:hypothetical protein